MLSSLTTIIKDIKSVLIFECRKESNGEVIGWASYRNNNQSIVINSRNNNTDFIISFYVKGY